jgi:hypothetical protein
MANCVQNVAAYCAVNWKDLTMACLRSISPGYQKHADKIRDVRLVREM